MKAAKRITMLFAVALAGILILIKQNLLDIRDRIGGKKNPK